MNMHNIWINPPYESINLYRRSKRKFILFLSMNI